jgi:hypothetical protein
MLQSVIANNEPVRHGDIVIIDGKQYAVRVIGDYSNCAVFDPLAA